MADIAEREQIKQEIILIRQEIESWKGLLIGLQGSFNMIWNQIKMLKQYIIHKETTTK